ncbi:MAG: peptide chain release factor 3, partial [Microvirga sp.]|nr:peptide chain release factor 3 [Microvirga sp.]
PNHGTLRIGDTLTEGEDLVFRGVPSFAPEILRRIKLQDAMKAKKLREALQQMAEEGVVQLFVPQDGSGAIVGVVGALQLDVLKERLAAEYGLPIDYDPTRSPSAAGSRRTIRASSTSSSRATCRPWRAISTMRPCSWRRTSSTFNTRSTATRRSSSRT